MAIAIRNFVLLTLLCALAIAGAGTFAQAQMASSNEPVPPIYDPLERLIPEITVGISTCDASATVEVRCSYTLERPGTGAYVSASAGATVRDSDGNPVVSADQPVGRTGAGTSGNLVPSATLASRTYVPAGVVCAPLIGCNNAVNGPGNAQARVLPGGSATTVATAGGSTTLTVTETCVNTAGGGCGTSGSSAAELSKVAVTRN